MRAPIARSWTSHCSLSELVPFEECAEPEAVVGGALPRRSFQRQKNVRIVGVITDLAKIRGLRVISRGSVMGFKGRRAAHPNRRDAWGRVHRGRIGYP